MKPNKTCETASGLQRTLCLAAGVLGIAVVWLVALPAVGREDSVRRHIERNRAQGIHPDAMFYTEMGAVDGVRLVYENGHPTVKKIRMGE